jgi:hypothetical protein
LSSLRLCRRSLTGKPAPFVSTFVDAVDAALCANRQVLQALRILEPVQFCPACPRDFHALAWWTPAIRHARSRMSFSPTTWDRAEGHGLLLTCGRSHDEAPCAINRRPSLLLAHYRQGYRSTSGRHRTMQGHLRHARCPHVPNRDRRVVSPSATSLNTLPAVRP